MKKYSRWALAATLSIGLVLFSAGCSEDDSGGGGLFSMADMDTSPVTWDMVLTPISGGLDKYFIEVSGSGGDGVAVVTITRKSGSGRENLGNHSVYDGVPIPLEPCGPTVSFSGAGFNLVAGDEWALMAATGQLMGPFPTGIPSSSINPTAAPNQTCAFGCPSGLFLGTPGIMISAGIGANVLIGIKVATSDYLINGDIPELYLMNFSTGYPLIPGSSQVVKKGDKIQVSYKRRIFSNRDGGDFFYVRLMNHRDYETIEELRERDREDVESVTYETTAKGSFLGVIFSVGLSSSNDRVILDDFRVKVNGNLLFSDNFEGATLANGLPDVLWSSVINTDELGSIGFTNKSAEVISGSQSYRFRGGRLFYLYGQAVKMEGIEAMEFNLTDGSIGGSYFMGMFMGAAEQNIIAGTYGGRNYDESCMEDGGFFVSKRPAGSADARGTWEITLDAELANCDDPTQNGKFRRTYSGVVFDQTQVPLGALLQGNVVDDGKGNQVQFQGFVTGTVVTIQMVTAVPVNIFYSGMLSGGVSELSGGTKAGSGQVMGFAAPDPTRMWETCDISGTYEASAP